MNFLELCQRTRQECGISGSGPVSVVAQTGENKRIVDWVNDAWLDLQRLSNDWGWMRAEFSFDTVIGQRAYGAIAGAFRRWHRNTFRYHLTSAGVATQSFLPFSDYDWFRDAYQFGVQTSGPPATFTVRPTDRSVLIGPLPDAVYTITGEYQRSATSMAANTDVPTGLPEEFHMILVYRAMMKYAGYEAAPEVMNNASAQYKARLGELQNFWLPQIGASQPLA